MNNQCELIQDLLPLYVDGVCSDASRTLVDEHLKDCPTCAAMLKSMQNETIDETLEIEKTNILENQQNIIRKKTSIAGGIVAGILLIPILICLIVNLAVGHGLSWFFIVLAAMLLTASLIVIPLIMPDHKFLWTAGLSIPALILLLGICCIISGGRWFWIASSAVLLGCAVILLPIAVNCDPLKTKLKGYKALTVMIVCTFCLILMLVCIGLFLRSHIYNRICFSVAALLISAAWIIFLIVKIIYRRKPNMSKNKSYKLIFILGLILCCIFAWSCGRVSVNYDNSESYTVCYAEISDKIENIEINWNCGSIILTEQESQNVSVSETADDPLKEDEKLCYLLEGSTLKIQYSAPKWFDCSIKKTLNLTLPKNLPLKKLTINSTSAETVLRLPSITAEKINITSTSGDVDLLVKQCGNLTVDATSGKISGQCDTLSKGILTNTSGSIELSLKHNAEALTIDSTSGAIILFLPDDADFSGLINTNSGEFTCDFPLLTKDNTILCGSGKSQLELRSTSGDIVIKKN